MDGETDLKVRKAIKKLHEKFTSSDEFFDDYEIEINPELNDLHHFFGKIFYLNLKDKNGLILKQPITMDNTIWAGCSVNNNEIVGIVIATGKETRLEKNSKTSKLIKTTTLDYKTNLFSIYLFVMMVVISFGNSVY